MTSPTRSESRQTPSTDSLSDEDVLRVLLDTLAYSREREYTGWDYADGMSSRLLWTLSVENKWLNLAVQETVKRAPINLRPLFLVEQRRNFMGAGLFALANLTVDRLGGEELLSVPRGIDSGTEASSLLDWLVQERCRGYAGFCGSH